jgi:hypothetical protein
MVPETGGRAAQSLELGLTPEPAASTADALRVPSNAPPELWASRLAPHLTLLRRATERTGPATAGREVAAHLRLDERGMGPGLEAVSVTLRAPTLVSARSERTVRWPGNVAPDDALTDLHRVLFEALRGHRFVQDELDKQPERLLLMRIELEAGASTASSVVRLERLDR